MKNIFSYFHKNNKKEETNTMKWIKLKNTPFPFYYSDNGKFEGEIWFNRELTRYQWCTFFVKTGMIAHSGYSQSLDECKSMAEMAITS